MLLTDCVEFEVIPFTECNLACQFCLQGKDRTLRKDGLTWDNVVEQITQLACTQTSNNVLITFCGGELLQDKFDDHYRDQLIDTIKAIRNLDQLVNKNVTVELVTNLVYNNIDRWLELFNECDEVVTSFDLDGRFTKQSQLRRWFDNIRYLFSHGIKPSVITVIHEFNYDKLLTIKTSNTYESTVFDWVCNNCEVDFNFLDTSNMRNPRYGVFDPQLIYQWFKWFDENYPNVIDQYYETRVNSSVPDRCGNVVFEIHGQYTNLQCCDKICMVRDIITRNKCFVCEYNRLCGFGCLRVQRDIALRSESCQYKRALKLIHDSYNKRHNKSS